jgi:hypothetical protein
LQLETVCARHSAKAVPLTGGTSTLIGPQAIKGGVCAAATGRLAWSVIEIVYWVLN